MTKLPPEAPITVPLREALRLLGVSRSRFYQWRNAGFIKPYRYNGNRPLYLRADVLALLNGLPRQLIAPLLPEQDRKLARGRASQPEPSDQQEPASEAETAP